MKVQLGFTRPRVVQRPYGQRGAMVEEIVPPSPVWMEIPFALEPDIPRFRGRILDQAYRIARAAMRARERGELAALDHPPILYVSTIPPLFYQVLELNFPICWSVFQWGALHRAYGEKLLLTGGGDELRLETEEGWRERRDRARAQPAVGGKPHYLTVEEEYDHFHLRMERLFSWANGANPQALPLIRGAFGKNASVFRGQFIALEHANFYGAGSPALFLQPGEMLTVLDLLLERGLVSAEDQEHAMGELRTFGDLRRGPAPRPLDTLGKPGQDGDVNSDINRPINPLPPFITPTNLPEHLK